MSIALAAAISFLKRGEPLEWKSSGSYKAGKVVLDTAQKRRLFDHLLSFDSKQAALTDENLFQGIIDAWNNEEYDPSVSNKVGTQKFLSGPWRLTKIESSGFGGLNAPAGPKFKLNVEGENWCIEGYNGSGKTSLTNLILWTMTGYSIREQVGLFQDEVRRESVCDSNGKKIGTWPPLITYPETPDGLQKDARVECKLTFVNPLGEKIIAQRKAISPVEGDPEVEIEIDPALMASAELIETGLLMPARIGYLGFGDRSYDLYQAIKMLSGLDKLADIATGASNLTHKSRKFLRYAKDKGIEAIENDFDNYVSKFSKIAEENYVSVLGNFELGAVGLIDLLETVEAEASNKASVALDTLNTEIDASLKLENIKDRNRLDKAVMQAHLHIDEGGKRIPLFADLSLLKKAHTEVLPKFELLIQKSKESLRKGLEWHSKQKDDKRLRLKALASKFFIPVEDLEKAATCPLCDAKLTSDAQNALATELAELKENADIAERKIADACGDIRKELNDYIPEYLHSVFPRLVSMKPREEFTKALKARFADETPYRDVLVGIAKQTEIVVRKATTELREFSFNAPSVEDSDIAEVKVLRHFLSNMSRLVSLGAWWFENRIEFLAVWNSLIGTRNAQGKSPDDSLKGKIDSLENIIASSKPLDEIDGLVKKAIASAKSWQKINEVQNTRIAIAEAIKPLKDLRNLVDCETHRTIKELSDKVTKVLADIYFKESIPV